MLTTTARTASSCNRTATKKRTSKTCIFTEEKQMISAPAAFRVRTFFILIHLSDVYLFLLAGNEEQCCSFPPLSFPVFLLSSRSFGTACTVQRHKANALPRTRRDTISRRTWHICKQLVLNSRFTWTFSPQKIRIWYQ